MQPAPDAAYLSSRVWYFYRDSKPGSAVPLRLLPDGRIGDHEHPNETTWRVEAGILELLNKQDIVTTRFNDVVVTDGRYVLSGQHMADKNIMLCLNESIPSRPRRRPGTKAALKDKISQLGWEIGEHSYGVPVCLEDSLAKLKIGKYTSIAAGVKIILGDHRTDMASSYPFSSLRDYWPSVPAGVPDHVTKGDVIIGNDVWIGEDVLITSGVTIGDGAVIGARSVVTKSIPPYAVAVGSPARVIRFRFTPSVVQTLLETAWWDLPDEVVDSYLPLLMSSDIKPFLEKLKSNSDGMKR
jgi:acetyltransferase-like isoleucine patch superfamily enzyme